MINSISTTTSTLEVVPPKDNIPLQYNDFLPTRVHRNHIPVIRKNAIKFALGKEISAALNCHNWNKNRYLRDLRKRKKQKLSIRSERRETLQALAYELIAFADYSIDSDYLFEVMTNVETLAKNIRQLHVYPSGRKSYDPVTKALRMLEEANLLIILRELDHETKQRKAMRIWLKPEFFYAFGFTHSRLRQKVKNLHKYRAKNGLLVEAKNIYKSHVQRLKYSNVADISEKYALKNLLLKIKNDFLSKETISNLEKTPEKSKSVISVKRTDEDIQLALANIAKLREMLNASSFRLKPK
ncbi:hypothetical protein ACFGWE_10660 [Pasteurella multocida]|uniref:hypothetical protein n=1 Tax=Pasteurella multocida TaxID=747 RepID=UPI0009F57B7B|nr:hypothetical protein [Pasteurella multocida]MEB3502254.1 hypothetical protein [Pasteurella multocida]PNM06779.1 hypothetical protein A6J89_000155 [Pasteurella multocida]